MGYKIALITRTIKGDQGSSKDLEQLGKSEMSEVVLIPWVQLIIH